MGFLNISSMFYFFILIAKGVSWETYKIGEYKPQQLQKSFVETSYKLAKEGSIETTNYPRYLNLRMIESMPKDLVLLSPCYRCTIMYEVQLNVPNYCVEKPRCEDGCFSLRFTEDNDYNHQRWVTTKSSYLRFNSTAHRIHLQICRGNQLRSKLSDYFVSFRIKYKLMAYEYVHGFRPSIWMITVSLFVIISIVIITIYTLYEKCKNRRNMENNNIPSSRRMVYPQIVQELFNVRPGNENNLPPSYVQATAVQVSNGTEATLGVDNAGFIVTPPVYQQTSVEEDPPKYQEDIPNEPITEDAPEYTESVQITECRSTRQSNIATITA